MLWRVLRLLCFSNYIKMGDDKKRSEGLFCNGRTNNNLVNGGWGALCSEKEILS